MESGGGRNSIWRSTGRRRIEQSVRRFGRWIGYRGRRHRAMERRHFAGQRPPASSVLAICRAGLSLVMAPPTSRDGSTIVGVGVSERGNEAFRWTRETGMVGLGDLPSGGFFSEANDVSADGKVVVGRSAGRNPFTYSAFRWTAENGMVEIPPTSGGILTVTAEAISADSNVIVGLLNSSIGPFAWDPYHGTRAIADLLREQGVDITGWELGMARYFGRRPDDCRPRCAARHPNATSVGHPARPWHVHS